MAILTDNDLPKREYLEQTEREQEALSMFSPIEKQIYIAISIIHHKTWTEHEPITDEQTILEILKLVDLPEKKIRKKYKNANEWFCWTIMGLWNHESVPMRLPITEAK